MATRTNGTTRLTPEPRKRLAAETLEVELPTKRVEWLTERIGQVTRMIAEDARLSSIRWRSRLGQW